MTRRDRVRTSHSEIRMADCAHGVPPGLLPMAFRDDGPALFRWTTAHLQVRLYASAHKPGTIFGGQDGPFLVLPYLASIGEVNAHRA